jgi:hypothetical protein
MSHDYHDTLGCPEDTIFYDGCEECEDRAKWGLAGLLTQDIDRVEAIWRRMLTNEGREADAIGRYGVDGGYRTDAEARIGKELYLLAVLLERCGNRWAFQQGLFCG